MGGARAAVPASDIWRLRPFASPIRGHARGRGAEIAAPLGLPGAGSPETQNPPHRRAAPLSRRAERCLLLAPIDVALSGSRHLPQKPPGRPLAVSVPNRAAAATASCAFFPAARACSPSSCRAAPPNLLPRRRCRCRRRLHHYGGRRGCNTLAALRRRANAHFSRGRRPRSSTASAVTRPRQPHSGEEADPSGHSADGASDGVGLESGRARGARHSPNPHLFSPKPPGRTNGAVGGGLGVRAGGETRRGAWAKLRTSSRD